ncbi:MAG: sigma-54 dependent transcriptional regulator [Pseudomonadota bacterium]
MEDFSELNLIGRSPAFLSALNLVRKFATCDATVLIQGETGTGKELVARAIHYLGVRRDEPFIPVNCGAIPDNLLENELFGHARGAFTDARDASSGLITEAEGGTLFLDEVEVLTPKGQVALLRFLQDGAYRQLGGKRLIDANVRVVAASNTNIEQLVAQNRFRADLLYRLAVMPVVLPPLRNRAGDVSLLAQHFVRRLNSRYRTSKRLCDSSLRALEIRAWPGNVRELENILHREFLLAEGEVMQLADLVAVEVHSREASFENETDAFEQGFSTAKARIVAEFEHRFLRWALAQSGGNVSVAARRAGKERRNFGRLLKKHGIDRARYAAEY